MEQYRYNARQLYALAENRKRRATNPAIFTRAVVVGAQNLRRLIGAGAVLGAGNDSGVPLTFPGMLHYELLMLTRAGMSNADALRAATTVNAALCRIENVAGAVEPGKRADLALLAGNPLVDIRNAGKVRAVFKAGRLAGKAEDFELG